MSSRHKISAVLLVLLALPGLVAGTGFAACLHEGAAQETCCPAPMSAADVEGSCCAVDETPPSASLHTGDTCGCSHAPQAPADRARATAPTAPETAAGSLPSAAVVAFEAPTPRTPAGAPPGGPPGEAHAIFILDCAFLI